VGQLGRLELAFSWEDGDTADHGPAVCAMETECGQQLLGERPQGTVELVPPAWHACLGRVDGEQPPGSQLLVQQAAQPTPAACIVAAESSAGCRDAGPVQPSFASLATVAAASGADRAGTESLLAAGAAACGRATASEATRQPPPVPGAHTSLPGLLFGGAPASGSPPPLDFSGLRELTGRVESSPAQDAGAASDGDARHSFVGLSIMGNPGTEANSLLDFRSSKEPIRAPAGPPTVPRRIEADSLLGIGAGGLCQGAGASLLSSSGMSLSLLNDQRGSVLNIFGLERSCKAFGTVGEPAVRESAAEAICAEQADGACSMD
jgi:hypothetical protein